MGLIFFLVLCRKEPRGNRPRVSGEHDRNRKRKGEFGTLTENGRIVQY